MVNNGEMQALQVWNVPGNVKRHNLAPHPAKHHKPTKPPIENEAALHGTVSGTDNLTAGLEHASGHGQTCDSTLLLIGKVSDAPQLADERSQLRTGC